MKASANVKIPFADELAIRVANSLATWGFIGLQVVTIGVWFVINHMYPGLIDNKELGHLDLSISIWTLLLDNVIILSTSVLTRIQSKQFKQLAQVTDHIAALETEHLREHDELLEEMHTHVHRGDTQEES